MNFTDNINELFEKHGLSRGALADKLAKIKAVKSGAKQLTAYEDIAVVGLACRLPISIGSPAELWDALLNRFSPIAPVGNPRRALRVYFDQESPASNVSQYHAGYLSDIESFDCGFFGLSPRELIEIDPQYRILAEVVWEALEDAGIALEEARHKTVGLFMGVGTDDFVGFGKLHNSRQSISNYSLLGANRGAGIGRLAYIFGFQGPAIAVDTTCSSSLVAIDSAVKSLREGESNVAIAGGVNLILSDLNVRGRTELGVLSKSNLCRAFDNSADGFVQGEGCGVVVLKTLSDAERDGDRVYCTIKGTTVNQNGSGNGMQAPSGLSQERLINDTHKRFGFDKSAVDYIEAHGTGTKLGDPIEARALINAFGDLRDFQDPLLIGSIKTNFGHLEPASGVLSFIKVALSLHHKIIPPQLHFEKPNEHIDWRKSPIKVVDEITPWPKRPRPSSAAVSSFGIAGTNAYAILQEYRKQSGDSKHPCILRVLKISAKSEAALKAHVAQYRAHIADITSPADLSHLCSNSLLRRSHFNYRVFFESESKTGLLAQIDGYLAGDVNSRVVLRGPGAFKEGTTSQLAFIFSGQGTHYLGMGSYLYESYSQFRETIEVLSERFTQQRGVSLESLMFSAPNTELSKTQNSQPAIFAFQVALADLFKYLGVQPIAVLGHSVGEFAAAYISGTLSLLEAFDLLLIRSQEMGKVARSGGMVAVFADVNRVRHLIEELGIALDIAAINSPTSCVISGATDELELCKEGCSQYRIHYVDLPVVGAFHSRFMVPAAKAVEAYSASLKHHKPRIPMISSVSASLFGEVEFSPSYWAEQITSPVNFLGAVKALIANGYSQFLEIGPKPALAKYIREIDATVTSFHSQDGVSQAQSFMECLVKLDKYTTDIRWHLVNKDVLSRVLDLPRHPLNRKKYPIGLNHKHNICSNEEPIRVRAEAVSTTTRLVKRYICELMEVSDDEADEDKSLFEMGADSFIVVALAGFISKNFHVDISVREIFESFNTITKISSQVGLLEGAPSRAIAVVPDFDTREELNKNTGAGLQREPDNDRLNATKLVEGQGASTETLIMEEVMALVSEVLGGDCGSVDPARALASLGADSFNMVMLVNKLNARWSVDLSVRELFESFKSVDDIARYILASGAVSLPEVECKKVHLDNDYSPPTRAAGIDLSGPDEPNSINKRNWMSNDEVVSLNRSHRFEEREFTADDDVARGPKLYISLTSKQATYLREFSVSYSRRLKESKQIAAESRATLCNNRKISAHFRLETKEFNFPVVAERAKGATLVDVDGNTYVDLSMGYGANLFGNSPGFVAAQIGKQLEKGYQLSMESKLAVECAQLLSSITGLKRVVFTNTGTEAVFTALRIARAATKKSKVVIFRDSYHGHSDISLVIPNTDIKSVEALPMTLGIPQSAVSEVIVLRYDSQSSLEYIARHADEIAAVLVEPVQNRRPNLHPEGFLKQLRNVTTEKKIVLIFDEILVGFRICRGGAQEYFDVQADIALYGKVIGGGMPIGAVAGKDWCMDFVDGGDWAFGDASQPLTDRTYTAGTFCKHLLALAASKAVLTKISDEGQELFSLLNARARRFFALADDIFNRHQVPLRINNFGSFFRFSIAGNLSFTYQPVEMDIFVYHMIYNGVYIWEGGTCFISTAHSNADMERMLGAIDRSIVQMKEGGFWGSEKAGPDTEGVPKSFFRANNPDAMTRTHEGTRGRTEPKPAIGPLVNGSSENVDCTGDVGPRRSLKFGLYYFGDYPDRAWDEIYDFIFHTSQYADRQGFHSVWLPERHFSRLGGFSPNPSLLAAAIAKSTTSIQLRASVVLPLRDPINVVEDWSVVQNMRQSAGVGLAFAPGWHAHDFVLKPDNWSCRHDILLNNMEVVRQLWQGDKMEFDGPLGKRVEIELFPKPKFNNLPMWLVTISDREVFINAGRRGVGILTNLLGQNIDELKENILAYKKARKDNGFDAEGGMVTLLIHTYVCNVESDVVKFAEAPLKRYIGSSIQLTQTMSKHNFNESNFDSVDQDDKEYIIQRALTSFIEGKALIGTVEQCQLLLAQIIDAGVNEVACFIDFGVDHEEVVKSLDNITLLKNQISNEARVADSKSFREVDLDDDQRHLLMVCGIRGGGLLPNLLTYSVRVNGYLDLGALEKAYRFTCAEHDSLRTTIAEHQDAQLVHSSSDAKLLVLDVEKFSDGDTEIVRRAIANCDQDAYPPHGLHRMIVARGSAASCFIIFQIDHVICDGFGLGCFVKSVSRKYNEIINGSHRRNELQLSYEDYIQRKRRKRDQEDYRRQLNFWDGRYPDRKIYLDLPFQKLSSGENGYRGKRASFSLELRVLKDLRRCASEHGMSPYLVALTAYIVTLYFVTGSKKVITGLHFSGRTKVDEQEVIGNCVTQYPVEFVLEEGGSVDSLLQEVKRVFWEVYENQEVSYSDLKSLGFYNAESRDSCLSNVFNWEVLDLPEFGLSEVLPVAVDRDLVKFPLLFNIMELPSGLTVDIDFSAEMFTSASIQRLWEYYLVSLDLLFLRENAPLCRSQNLCSFDESIRDKFFAASAFSGADILDHLERQVQRKSSSLALCYQDDCLSYNELDQVLKALAEQILSLRPAASFSPWRVGICLPRSQWQIISILAVLEAGASFVPIEFDAPQERVEAIINAAGLCSIICHPDHTEMFSRKVNSLVKLDQALKEVLLKSNISAPARVTTNPDAEAYTIFTSGTTGAPKGVSISRRSLGSFIWAYDEVLQNLGVPPEGAWGWDTDYTFDMSLKGIGQMVLGRPLVVIPKALKALPKDLLAYMDARDVEIWSVTPRYLDFVIASLDDTQAIPHTNVGGEFIDQKLWEKFRAVGERFNVRVFNTYGPTEACVSNTYSEITRNDFSTNIGMPLKNTSAIVLDVEKNEVPIGSAGELYLFGSCLASGYLNNGHENGDKFVELCLRKQKIRAYRTGDVVRISSEGNLEYFGRIDRQMNVNGYRVEPAEIEAKALEIPIIAKCVVVPYLASERECVVVAYLVVESHTTTEFCEESFKAALKQKLPSYSIPSIVQVIDEIPLTNNGKIHYAYLSKLAQEKFAAGIVCDGKVSINSGGEVRDSALAAEIKDFILSITGAIDIDRHKNLFSLGLSSLMVLKIVSWLSRLKGISVTIKDVYQHNSLSSLTDLVQSKIDDLSKATFFEETI